MRRCGGRIPSFLPSAACLCQQRPFPLQVWEETYQRVANEQEIYEGTADGQTHPSSRSVLQGTDTALSPPAQLHDLLQLRQENSCLTTITKQIAPYVRSIAKVKERLEPR